MATTGGWRLLRPVIREHRRSLAGVAAWSLLGALPVLLSGRLIAVALDQGFLAGRALLGFTVLAGYAAALAMGAFAVRQAMRPMGEFTEAARDHLVRTVVRGGLADAVATGGARPGTEARLVSQVETARQIVSNLVMSVTSAGLMVVAAAVGLFALAPIAVVALLPPILLVGAVLAVLTKIWRRRYHAVLAAEESLTDDVNAVLHGLRDVAACAATDRAMADVDRGLCAHTAAVGRAANVGAARIAVIGLAARLPLVLLLLVAPQILANGTLTPGELAGAVIYVVSGLEPAWRAVVEIVGNQGVELSTILARLARHGTRPEAQAAEGLCAPTRGKLELRGVTFRYGRHSAPVLDNANLVIEDGERVAVLGPSGIGKSTLATVLTGLERPESGSVEFDGVALSGYRADSLRRSMALIPQESYVFAGTVRENITLLAPDVDDVAMDHTVHELGLTGLVERLGGIGGWLRTQTLSAGERQLIALARVHLSPARLVVLDEATCHLDIATEARVENAFRRRGGTLIVIAHRASSAARASRVLVLDETGLHDSPVLTSRAVPDSTHRPDRSQRSPIT